MNSQIKSTEDLYAKQFAPSSKEYQDLHQIAWKLRHELDEVKAERDDLRTKLEISESKIKRIGAIMSARWGDIEDEIDPDLQAIFDILEEQ